MLNKKNVYVLILFYKEKYYKEKLLAVINFKLQPSNFALQ